MSSRAKPHPTGDLGKGKWLTKPGDTFGRWTVLHQDLERRAAEKARFWFCQCVCGTIKSVSQKSLRSLLNGGRGTKGCGAAGCRPYKHRLSKTSTYRIWVGMKKRCQDPEDRFYKNYGGRGIKICDKWSDFAAFVEDMGIRPGEEYSIDRIDTNGGYAPDNCRWATRREQQGNTRNNVFLEFNGKRMHLTDWARETGIKVGTINTRHRRGYPAEDILHPGRLPMNRNRGRGNYLINESKPKREALGNVGACARKNK